MTLTQRIKQAWHVITRGGNWESTMYGQDFNRATMGDSGQASITKPYEQSVWVSRAIKKIAQPISAVPLKFENETNEQEIQDETLDAYWKRPAQRLSWADTVEASVGWMNLKGEAFWVLGDEWLLPFPAAYEPFMVARPDRMGHIVTDGELMGWKFRDGRGRDHLLLPEQVIQLKLWNPYDEWRGLAPYLAAQIATEADYFASTFNRNLWEQNGDRGPYVIGKSGMPTDTQREQILSQLREKRAAASSGQFKAAFLTGDITIEDPKIQTIDANAVAVRLSNRHEIALAFGVPPSMFDVIASYSIGSASDRFVLIEETCMPMGAKIADEVTRLSQRIMRMQTLCAYMDWDEHSTMQAVRRERIASATALWQMGQPMESVNQYLRMGLKPYVGWDSGYLSYALAPIDQVLSGASVLFDTQDELDAAADLAKEQSEFSAGADKIAAAFARRAEVPGGGDDVSAWQARRPKRELAMARQHEAQMNRIAKTFESAFNRVLMAARADTLRRIAALNATGKSIVQRAAAADIVFDIHAFRRGVLIAMRNVATKALTEAGQTVMDEMEIRDPWTTPPAEVIAFNRVRENKIVGAADNVFARINADVEASIKDGDSIAQMADKIKASFNEISRGRAKTIARTETGAAYGQGRQIAMESAGVKWKEWLTSGRDNVRPEHVAANGQRVRVTEKFDVGGEELEGPGDPSGSAGNVINCNCVAIAVAGPTEDEATEEE